MANCMRINVCARVWHERGSMTDQQDHLGQSA
jgi:hypothetical protein